LAKVDEKSTTVEEKFATVDEISYRNTVTPGGRDQNRRCLPPPSFFRNCKQRQNKEIAFDWSENLECGISTFDDKKRQGLKFYNPMKNRHCIDGLMCNTAYIENGTAQFNYQGKRYF
jgi:hypothetical protein